MCKAHKIFYQNSDVKKPFAIELCVYYAYPKIFDIDGAVYHEELDRNVRSFYYSIYDSYAKAFDKVWNEIVIPLSEKYPDFKVSKSDYHIMRAEFEKLLEENMS